MARPEFDRARRRYTRRWVAAMLGSTAMVVGIDLVLFVRWHVFLRSWGLHFFALVAATLGTTWLVGVHRATSTAQRRAALWIGCSCPLVITLLHEAGQWLWPVAERDTFDTLRDAGLNVLGTAAAFWLIRHPAPGIDLAPRRQRPERGCEAGADGGQLPP
ncbi:MAG: hypothetical protein JNL08_15430 [Planctomycetes bacterium]|nr:hypothetical protein [Planctomycetota bacterium]